MTLVDSNIFTYAAGREHPFKKRATAFLEKAAEGSVAAVIDAEGKRFCTGTARWDGRKRGGRFTMRCGLCFRRCWR